MIVFGGKSEAENKKAFELFVKLNTICDKEDWHIVMIAVANLMQAGLDLAPEDVDARRTFEAMVSAIRKRVW